jgi:hypothetical protein
VPFEEPAPQPRPDREARRVAEEGGQPGERKQQRHVDLALARDDPAEDHGELARSDETDERAGL